MPEHKFKTLTIPVTKQQYYHIEKLVKPEYSDYKKILGQDKALQILSATYHGQTVEIKVTDEKYY